ncbi:hypothetical protein PG994_003365 [Apiospora phragmitis]|uniref:Uncharacterized protein n=1 Tax=Apiospora phragmitis TaxID=2905665 RepID=A0ABR1VXY2_9PEZI
MPPLKPLPSLPTSRRKVRIVSPSTLLIAPKAAKIAGTREKDPKRGFPPSSYAHLLLSEDDEEDQEDQHDEEEEDHQAEASKHAEIVEDIDSDLEHIQIGGPTYMKIFKVSQLEKKVSKLEKENNDQVNRAIRQQNQLVARIANTISLVFQEYQETVEKSGHLTEANPTPANTTVGDDMGDDSSGEIKIYSQFDLDSDSGSEY